MTAAAAPRYRIVVALDLGEYSEVVLEHALEQAAHQGAPDLHVVHIVSQPKADLEAVKKQLGALVLPALDALNCTDWRLHVHVRAGKPVEEITNLAGEQRAHLLVVGRFGTHHPHRRIGLLASQLVDLAPCPTLVVGLTDQTSDTAPQCGDCVALREHSEGRQWFCPAHAAPDRLRLSTTITPGSGWSGGLMW